MSILLEVCLLDFGCDCYTSVPIVFFMALGSAFGLGTLNRGAGSARGRALPLRERGRGGGIYVVIILSSVDIRL